MLDTLRLRFSAARALGLRNVARVVWYRAQLSAGLHRVQRIREIPAPRGVFFSPPSSRVEWAAPSFWDGTGRFFGWFAPENAAHPPAWHANIVTGATSRCSALRWWTIPDFDPAVGDIKTVWEASRMDWVMEFAQQSRRGGEDALHRLNAWLDDWSRHNPPYRGANWKCGQEASIRVMHLATAALITDQVAEPSPSLRALIAVHCARIAPTIAYAIGQDNNHGTSEAAALIIGGSWLMHLGDEAGRSWYRQGISLLSDRAARLIEVDGSFSQHSLNYHRLMLDTLSLVEVWRRRLNLDALDGIVTARAGAAARWLHAMVDPITGDAPNLGANDGANLLPLTTADYRDYRPSVQLAVALFLDAAAYQNVAVCDSQLQWLGVSTPRRMLPGRASTFCDDGGYVVMVQTRAMVLFRYPRFRFRPGHNDALHVDLWLDGVNVLRDGGSYSYNAGPEWPAYFAGARGQNSIQFDGRESMPKVSRFLWGEWLRTEELTPLATDASGTAQCAASYRDWLGASHRRHVSVGGDRMLVVDRVAGFTTASVLRWRLAPDAWILDGTTLTNGRCELRITADVPIIRCELVTGWESRYYLQKTEIPVLEVEIGDQGSIETLCRWVA